MLSLAVMFIAAGLDGTPRPPHLSARRLALIMLHCKTGVNIARQSVRALKSGGLRHYRENFCLPNLGTIGALCSDRGPITGAGWNRFTLCRKLPSSGWSFSRAWPD
jgi:signal transduction histidine kinase